MGVFSCPDCGGTVSDRAVACPHCGAPVRAGVPSFPKNMQVDPSVEVCLTCHSLVRSKREAKGPAWIGWVLLPFYVMPGILYFAWRRWSRRPICPKCGAEALVPATSTRGVEIISGASNAGVIEPPSHAATCPSCLLPVSFPAGRRTIQCPYCTTNLTLTETGRIETD